METVKSVKGSDIDQEVRALASRKSTLVPVCGAECSHHKG